MADFVLIHGAFRGGWAWSRVEPRLTAAGHRVVTLTLSDSADVTLDSWANEIVSEVELHGLENVTLVGHSQGGIVAQAAAEKMSTRVSRIVFLDSPVLCDGESAVDIFPEDIRAKMPPIERDAIIEPMPVMPNEFISAVDASWMNQHLRPQPARPGFDAIHLSAEIPHTYIFCRFTPPFFPASYTRARFDREGIDYSLIDAPHDCNVTHPAEVAEALLR